MDKQRRLCCVLVVFCMLIVFAFASPSNEDEEKINKQSLVERLTSLLYVSSSPSNSPATSTGNWDKLKTLVNQARAYFSPPNLEGSEENEPISSQITSPSADGGGGGAGDKVKEAVTRSLEKSKEAVEDSAKSAAKIASETVVKTKEKVKKSLSTKREAEESEEL